MISLQRCSMVVTAVALSGPALAAPVFGGDVTTDFTEPGTLTVVDPNGIDVGLPTGFPASPATISGNDMEDIRFFYELSTDTLYVGINSYTIAGDVDDDGDAGNTGAILAGLGGTDVPDFGGTESFLVVIDKDQDGQGDIIAGVNTSNDIGSFDVFRFNNIPFALTTPAVLGFGPALPGFSGGLFASPNASAPDLEFTIQNFSMIPTTSGGDMAPNIDMLVFVGSLSDAGIGEDFIPGSGLVEIPFCGNGNLDDLEECDDGNNIDGDGCEADCTAPICGDGDINQPFEECDDGNNIGGDGCEADCALPVCGDGSVNHPDEECDDGNTVDGDGCEADCTLPMCGDGSINQPFEECDDGNTVSGDGCEAGCILPVCGDGSMNQPGEECDDGNTVDGDGCEADCTIPVCGDGSINQPTEECDDGNTVNGDGCEANCILPFCGDGSLNQPFELCDDGNFVDGDGCDSTCTFSPCGDGIVNNPSEQCDDGNNVDDDGCSNSCEVQSCGDGFVNQGSESCDDGNLVNGDGCDSMCQPELCPAGDLTGVYHSGGGPNVVIDSLTGLPSDLLSMGVPVSVGLDGVTAVAVDTRNSVIYYATGDNDDSLWALDQITDTLVNVGPFGPFATNVQAMDLADDASAAAGFMLGMLYGVSIDGVGNCNPNCLVEIDPATGLAVPLGAVAGNQVRGLSFNPITGELWAYDPGGKVLSTIAPDGTVTVQTTIQHSNQFLGTGIDTAFSLAHDCSGDLYTVDIAYGLLVHLDPVTGEGTWVGEYGDLDHTDGGFDLAGLDSNAACECPTTFPLAGAACEVELDQVRSWRLADGSVRALTSVELTNFGRPIRDWELSFAFTGNDEIGGTAGHVVALQDGNKVSITPDRGGDGVLLQFESSTFGLATTSTMTGPPIGVQLNGQDCVVRIRR